MTNSSRRFRTVVQKFPYIQIHNFSFLLRFPESDYRPLAGNLDGLLAAHDSMNAALAEATAAGFPPREQRVGRAFLAHGAAVRAAHLAYWAGHPRAVAAIDRNRDRIDKFIEGTGARVFVASCLRMRMTFSLSIGVCNHLLYSQSKARQRRASCT